jgi:hypothetical protein
VGRGFKPLHSAGNMGIKPQSAEQVAAFPATIHRPRCQWSFFIFNFQEKKMKIFKISLLYLML